MTLGIVFSIVVGGICAFFVALETRPGFAFRMLVGRWICSATTGHDFGPWTRFTAVLAEHRVCRRCTAIEERRYSDPWEWYEGTPIGRVLALQETDRGLDLDFELWEWPR